MRCLLLFGLDADLDWSVVRLHRRCWTSPSLLAVLLFTFFAVSPISRPVIAQATEAPADSDAGEDSDKATLDLGGVDQPLKTKDGLRMSCRFYASADPGKETIPVVLLHGWKGQGSDFDALALNLSSEEGGGHSVIVPDLRGHGGSTELRPEGSEESIELNDSRTGKPEFHAMIKYDLEAVKKFLLERHNAEELNIDALTVMGADMGGVLALYWTAQDWSWKPLAGVKQGQDVKAVGLLSPPTSFKGIAPQVALNQPDLRKSVSLLLLYGKNDTKATSAATRFFNTVKRHRPQVFDSPEEKREKLDLFLIGIDTLLQGTDLLSAELPTDKYIAQFIEGRVRKHMDEDFPWKLRRRAE